MILNRILEIKKMPDGPGSILFVTHNNVRIATLFNFYSTEQEYSIYLCLEKDVTILHNIRKYYHNSLRSKILPLSSLSNEEADMILQLCVGVSQIPEKHLDYYIIRYEMIADTENHIDGEIFYESVKHLLKI